MRDRPTLNEAYKLKLSGAGTVSGLDNSETHGDEGFSFPRDFVFDGNQEL